MSEHTNNSIVLYQSEDGACQLEVMLQDDSVWLSQEQMANLFQVAKSTISYHISGVLGSNELEEESVVRKIRTTAPDGKVYIVHRYNLDMIISVGYRVNTRRGVQFRKWATEKLSEYIIKGFTIDDARMAASPSRHFEELAQRIRSIRTSEIQFSEKVKAIFATSEDYDPNSDTVRTFFSTVQNKFHYAITGQTAAEIIRSRLNAFKPNLGLKFMKGRRVSRHDLEIAKNYYEVTELKLLELLVEQFLSFAEFKYTEGSPMRMTDWLEKLDKFIALNDRRVLQGAGSVSRKDMLRLVAQEFERYAEQQYMSGHITYEEFKKLAPGALHEKYVTEQDE